MTDSTSRLPDEPIRHSTTDLHSSHQVAIAEPTVPRLCRLSREKRDDPYGFDFKTIRNEGRHVANNVKPGYPAYRAGLRDDDYILEVNGQPINGMEHESVVQLISSNTKAVDLLVVSDLAALSAKSPGSLSNMTHDEVDLDLITVPGQNNVTFHRVVRPPGVKTLGISLMQDGKISNIDANSPSDAAGLKPGDRIVEVNGVSVKDKNMKEIAKLIKANENNLIIGVISSGPTPIPTIQTNESSLVKQVNEEHRQQTIPSPYPVTDSTGHGNLKNIVEEATRAQTPQPHSSLSSSSGKKISGTWFNLLDPLIFLLATLIFFPLFWTSTYLYLYRNNTKLRFNEQNIGQSVEPGLLEEQIR